MGAGVPGLIVASKFTILVTESDGELNRSLHQWLQHRPQKRDLEQMARMLTLLEGHGGDNRDTLG